MEDNRGQVAGSTSLVHKPTISKVFKSDENQNQTLRNHFFCLLELKNGGRPGRIYATYKSNLWEALEVHLRRWYQRRPVTIHNESSKMKPFY